MFYKHILSPTCWTPQSEQKSSSEPTWEQGGKSFGLKAVLSPKRYSEMNIWVTLALIFVYLTVHFKIDSDGCWSLDIYFSGVCFSCTLFYHHFAFHLWTHSCSFSLTKTPDPSSTSFTLVALSFHCSSSGKRNVSVARLSNWHWKAIKAGSLRVLCTPFLPFKCKHFKWFKVYFPHHVWH